MDIADDGSVSAVFATKKIVNLFSSVWEMLLPFQSTLRFYGGLLVTFLGQLIMCHNI